MCQKAKIISQSQNGYVLQCQKCQSYQVSFGTIFLEFTPEEMDHFKNFLTTIDVAYWEKRYCNCPVKRNIPIPTLQSNLQIILSVAELEELKLLLGVTTEHKPSLISFDQVDYLFVLN